MGFGTSLARAPSRGDLPQLQKRKLDEIPGRKPTSIALAAFDLINLTKQNTMKNKTLMCLILAATPAFQSCGPMTAAEKAQFGATVAGALGNAAVTAGTANKTQKLIKNQTAAQQKANAANAAAINANNVSQNQGMTVDQQLAILGFADTNQDDFINQNEAYVFAQRIGEPGNQVWGEMLQADFNQDGLISATEARHALNN